MLMAHPAVLRNLVEQYEMLLVLRDGAADPDAARRLEDVTYTLCVSTGTREADAALAAARAQLAAVAPPPGAPLLSGA
ncbi:DUF5133 domain-containing protein [Streptomyces avicenniae]|uniref:DUF5133 domain-containing protein n=1 Tax=Streptomyces avicenniae TaxID=500153 RepID=UPI00069B8021|nr:DUF5133 domain-containing protein [Streptomyces avicenniae]